MGLIDNNMEEEVYRLDISNPVCPCCGKRLVLFDSTEEIPNDSLTEVEPVNENVNGARVDNELDKILDDAVAELLSEYVPDNDDMNSWKTDQEVRSWVRRKSGELHFIILEEYKIDIDLMKIEEAIIEKIQEKIQ